MVELIMSLTGGMDDKKPFNNENNYDRLSRKLDMVTSDLKENKKRVKAFTGRTMHRFL